MADQTATYQVNLEGNLSGEAKKAAEALAQLEKQIAADTKELAAMQKALRNLKGASTPNTDQIGKLEAKIKASKEAIAGAQSKFIGLGGAFGKTGGSGKGLTEKLKALSAQAAQMPGPIGSLVTTLGSLKTLLAGGAIAAGAMAIVAALAALAVGAVAATRSLYNYGVAQADARRSELLRLEGLTKMRYLFQRIPGDARQMQNAIDEVAAKTPVARAEIARYTTELHGMGLRGAAAAKVLEAVAIKHATQGAAAASAFAGWAAGVNATGQSVDKLVDKVKGRLGGIAAKQMESLTVQAEKQQEAFDALFGGLDIGGWLSAWKQVRDLLGQATASGKALKFMITTLLQPLIGASTEGAPIVKRFFQTMIIGALHLIIVVLQVRKWLRATFSDSAFAKWLKDSEAGSKTAKLMIGGLIGVITVLGAAIMVLSFKIAMFLIPVLWGLAAPLLPFIAAAFGVGAAIYSLITYWDDLVIAFEQLDWFDAGLDILDGIIAALDPTVLGKHMIKLGASAISSFADAIGAASPAKAFVKVGATIPEGVAAGVEAGTPEAQAAAANMIDPTAPALGALGAATGGAPPAAAVGGRLGAGATVTIGEIHVHASSSKPEQLAMDFRRELERVLAGFASELGAPGPA